MLEFRLGFLYLQDLRLLDDLRAATTDSAGIMAGRLLLVLVLVELPLDVEVEEEVVAALEAVDLEGEETAPTEAASTIIRPSVALSWLCWC